MQWFKSITKQQGSQTSAPFVRTRSSLRVLQNNKALKHKSHTRTVPFCLRVLQNNKALKRIQYIVLSRCRLRVLQNNKALKLKAQR